MHVSIIEHEFIVPDIYAGKKTLAFCFKMLNFIFDWRAIA